jgi:hypothetical protein
MVYTAEIGSGAIIYIPDFMNIGGSIQMLMGRTHRQHGDRISLRLFSQNKGSRLRHEVA